MVVVVMPALNEELSIVEVVQDFLKMQEVSRVVVVDNGSKDQTAHLARSVGAHVIGCATVGFGAALKKGLLQWIDFPDSEAIFLVESDGTFVAKDLRKFLVYSEEADVIVGSRTSRAMIWDGAYMPHWVRIGNWLVAKLAEFLYNGPSLTDIGCTAKLINKDAIKAGALDSLTDRSHFNEQFLVYLLKSNIKLLEIPINYRARVGKSKITGGNFRVTFKLGILMIFDLVQFKFSRKYWV